MPLEVALRNGHATLVVGTLSGIANLRSSCPKRVVLEILKSAAESNDNKLISFIRDRFKTFVPTEAEARGYLKGGHFDALFVKTVVVIEAAILFK